MRAQVLTEADQESKHWVNSQLDFKEYLTKRGIQEGLLNTLRGSVALNCSADQFAGGFAQYYLMIARAHDPTGFNAFPLANLLTFIILIYPTCFLHRWKASEGPVLELNIEVVRFFHLVFSIPRRGGTAETYAR